MGQKTKGGMWCATCDKPVMGIKNGPVDHIGAAFAIDLMRVLLSHLLLMLAAEGRRAAHSAA